MTTPATLSTFAGTCVSLDTPAVATVDARHRAWMRVARVDAERRRVDAEYASLTAGSAARSLERHLDRQAILERLGRAA